MFAVDDLLIPLLSDKLTARSILREICFIVALIQLSISRTNTANFQQNAIKISHASAFSIKNWIH
jgi:hypothetical protein